MMNSNNLTMAIKRIESLMRLKGQQLSPVLMGDLQVLIDHANAQLQTGNKCDCHERDGSYVCEYCRSYGMRGHMETT